MREAPTKRGAWGKRRGRVSDEVSEVAAQRQQADIHDRVSEGDDRASEDDTTLTEHTVPVDAPAEPSVLGFSSMSEAIEQGLLDAGSLAPRTSSPPLSRAGAAPLPPALGTVPVPAPPPTAAR